MTNQKSQPVTNWELFRRHRGIVTELICSEAPPNNGRLCILGAGQCNDIDLKQLLTSYGHVTLVDLDTAALQAGIAQQEVPSDSRIELLGGVDLAGNTKLLEQYAQQPDPQVMDSIMEHSGFQKMEKLGVHDVVASKCVLSQLLGHVVNCVEDRGEEFVDLLKKVRRSHLEIMLNAIKPGGVGILITDFVSSESLPELLETEDLQTTVTKAIKANDFFHGLNPHMVARVLTESDLKNRLETLDITAPWRWITAARVYACFAIVFKKNAAIT